MPPIITFGAVPPGDPGGDQRAIKSSGELLQSRKQRSCIDYDRQRLNKRDVGMLFHGGGEPHDRVARHQAVRVQDNHMIIAGPEPSNPVFDIAGLACGVLGAVTIK